MTARYVSETMIGRVDLPGPMVAEHLALYDEPMRRADSADLFDGWAVDELPDGVRRVVADPPG